MKDICQDDLNDLKELFKAQIDQVNILINANDKAYNQRFDNNTDATKAALASADRATTKAENAAEKRFEGVNEFRNTLADQQRTLMPRAEYEVQHKALYDKIVTMETTIYEKIGSLNQTTISRQSQGLGQREGMVTVSIVAGIVATIIVVLSRFVK